MKKQLFISLGILLLMVTATAAIIFYGKGYRFGFNQGTPAVSGTGLLVVTSAPDGAQVFINGHLTTATDNTINLTPGEYNVKIFKDGYFPWAKKITIKKEVVSKADALLLPTAPKLESITNIGVANPLLDPTQTKIAYTVASQSALKNGLYVLDMTLRPILTLQSSSVQIATDTIAQFSQSSFKWSPDSKQILANLPLTGTNYLLSPNSLNTDQQDITLTLPTVNSLWEKLIAEKQKASMDSLNKKLRPIVLTNFNILDWSGDETKILYVASVSANIPLIINPELIGTDSTPQQRNIQKGSVYVYDIKEDRNYKILDSLPTTKSEDSPSPIMWYPDSKHLVYVHNQKIDLMEYDAGNQITVYAGPFVDSFVFPWPDATKIVILTNLGNPNITPNLYTISLK